MGYGVPTHDYPFVGEAVVGRNLDELRLAIDSGLRLDAISPRLSVSGRYSYAFVEEVLDLPIDRSTAYLSAGWLFTQRLVGSLDLYWQYSHGGVTNDDFFAGVPDEVFIQFDRILKDNSFHLSVSSLPSRAGGRSSEVDQDGDTLDILVQSRRDQRAAARFFRSLLKGQGRSPRRLITEVVTG